jgi:outer membrane receptor protein involved in Fe transport
MEQVVVTGSITPRTKLESTIAVSTLDARDLELASPRSSTEALRYVPGFTRVESSGGEVNQNITIRGILGVEYVMFMENELPVFPTMHSFFMNADNLFRVDENVENMEVIRGGNSALFGSNTPGAIVNIIDKTGGSELQGSIRATAGTDMLARYDFNVNGPLAENWRFNLGGFYRYDHGVRDPGFPGVVGGQLKANITRLLDNGYIRASLKMIDDRNQFILPLPFQNPDDPEYVPGFSDYGSMNTLEGNRITVPLATGDQLTLPLDNGLRTQAFWFTADLSFDFAGGWNIKNTAQIMQNAQQWNAIVPQDVVRSETGVSNYIQSYYGSYYTDVLKGNGTLPGTTNNLRVALLPGYNYQLTYTNQKDANGNSLPYNTSNGLLAPSGQWHIEKPMSAFQNQLQVRKSVGKHNFSAGLYFANYSQDNKWYFTDILMDVRDNPRFVDLFINNASLRYTYTSPFSGNDTSVTVSLNNVQATKNGFRKYLSNYTNGSGTTTIISGTIGGELILSEKLRVDFGVRYEWNNFVQSAENVSSVDLDNNPGTLYDVEPWGNGSFRHFDRSMDDWAASLGVNYKLNNNIALFAQGSRAYKMPALDEFLNATAQAQVELFEARETRMVDGGIKYSGNILSGSLSGFWGEILNNIGQGLVVDPNTGASFWEVTVNPDARVVGVEVEAAVTPAAGLQISAVGTLLNSKTVEGGGSALTAGGIPSFVGNLLAAYTSEIGLGFKVDFHYVGKRDIIDASYDTQRGVYTRYNDVGDLDAYHYINAGLSYTFPNRAIIVNADVLNAYQSKGLEEGNPRLISSGGNQIFLARPILPRRLIVSLRYQF